MKNTTICTLCNRRVSAVRNWARWQSGQSPEWRVARHRVNEKRAPSGRKETICPGTAILVPDADVQQAVTA